MIEFAELASGQRPRWDGTRFLVGDKATRVLVHSSNMDGWDDDLTELHEAEAGSGDHPIDVASRQGALRSLRQFAFPSDGAVLEVGCSSGYFIRDFKREYPNAEIVGTDVARGALERLGKELSGVPLLQMDVLQCRMKPAQFDAVVALNVLEHIEDDMAALRSMATLLKPNGILIVEVPQGPGLYDYYDGWLRHFRRYTKRDLTEKLRQAGLQVEQTGFIGFVAYLPFWIVKKLRRFRFGTTRAVPNVEQMVRESIKSTRRSRSLTQAFAIDAAFLRLIRLPIGIRCTAVARVSAQTSTST